MYKIIRKKQLTDVIYLMDIYAPLVASSGLPGQFVITINKENGERIPLTICDINKELGTVTIVFQTIGKSTYELATFNEGDSLFAFVGPLGKASDLISMNEEELKNKNIIFIGGGVGIAPIYPQLKWLKEHGYHADVILGARSKDILIFEDEIEEVCNNLYICTDDGSYGFKGNVCDMLKEIIKQKNYDHCVCIGPMMMMKFVCLLTKELNIPTVVSLNPIMVDGTGMCGACRVLVDNKVKFACVDGPEFDGHLVDFDSAIKKQRYYLSEEEKAKNQYIIKGCGGK